MKRLNLFLKIYLSFWLTIVITVGAFVYLDRMMTTEPVIMHWQKTVDKTVSFYAEEAAAIYDRDGAKVLENYFHRLEKATGIEAFLFNESGREVTGKPVRKDILEQTLLAFQKSGPSYRRNKESGISTEEVKGPQGHYYLFTAVIPHPRPPGLPPGLAPVPPPYGPRPALPPAAQPPNGPHSHFIIRLAIGLSISGIICYLLARYLTGPIFNLGSAARQLANGNLSVRVKPAMGSRRDELSALAGDFDVMAEQIEALITSQHNLLRDVSHELRSPLARLNVALELCRQHSVGQTQKHLDRMALETERLNDLIGQILTYNKIKASPVEIEKTKFDLSGLIEKIVADANYEAKSSRSIVLLNKQVFINGNEDLLRRAIENIIRNALYHTPENSNVEISSEPVLWEGNTQARIIVRDHGQGVPREALHLIFKPFFKLGCGEKRHNGAGLGLSISEAAILLHQGAIRADNADDGGLMMEINLPAENSKNP
jgi:signal transduction histidine kinase